jgi:IS30 family transposase
MARQYRPITREEREKLAEMYKTGMPMYRIANSLDRSPGAIMVELKRGYTGKIDQNNRPEYDMDLSEKKLYENVHRRGSKKKDKDDLDGQETLC